VAKKHGNSKYDPKFIDQMLEYFGVEPYHQVIKKISEKTEDGTARTAEIPQFSADGRPILEISDFPTLAGFAIKIGVNRDTLAEWAKNFAEFSGAYKKAKDYQENWLAVNSLKGLLPPASAIFTQKNVIGWRDKQPDEVDVVVNNHTLSDEQLDNRIEALMRTMKKEK
jgi:hypothetical protein